MSNLRTAIQAIEAEIAHAKQGLAHYAERVRSLEAALAGIVLAGDGAARTASTTPKAAKSHIKASRKKGGSGKKAAVDIATQVAELPATGGDYWKNLVTDEPKSGKAILAEAVGGLGFTPTKTQVAKLMNRMTFALNSMVKAGTIQDSGAGRERRYFKK